MSSPTSEQDLLNALAEEFAQRQRLGEHPSLTEYTERYPQLADQIRELFPALALMEQVRPAKGEATAAGETALTAGPARLERLGDYRIVREVGRGGMGVVYEAVQESLGRHVALKVLPLHTLLKPTHLQRFEREAKAAARLHHSNIVPVYGVGADQGVYYYAMQLIEGQGLDVILEEVRRLRHDPAAGRGSIAQRLWTDQPEAAAVPGGVASTPASGGPASGPSPAPRPLHGTQVNHTTDHSSHHSELASQTEVRYCHSVARVGVQVAEALAYAHKQGVLHRDIKPSNLLLDAQGTVWVTDFGLAKADDSGELTSTGDIVGTLRFMAPERFGGISDARGDVYSVGVTLYELVTLQPAFADSNRLRLIERVKSEEPPRPCVLNRRIPRDLETILLKAVEKEPARRYATAGELAEDLRRFLDDKPIQARPVGILERLRKWARRRPTAAALVAVSVLAALGLVVGLLWHTARLDSALQRAEDSRAEAQRERQQAVTNLYHSHVREARALRLARVDGYRPEVWQLLQQARQLDTPARNVDELRREAISCLGDFVGLQPTLWEDFAETRLSSLALHPDSVQLALGLSDGTIVLRNLVTGAEITRLREHRSPVTSLYFAPAGTRLVSSEERAGTSKIWELNANGQWHGARTITLDPLIVGYGPSAVFPFVVPYVLSPRVVARALSADGRQFATAHAYGPPFVPQSTTISIWNLADGSLAAQFSGLGQEILTSLAFSPDGNLLAAGYRTKAEDGILMWHVATRQVERRMHLVNAVPVPSVSFSPNGKLLACGTVQGLFLFDTATFQRRSFPAGYAGWALAFSPDSQLLAFPAYQRAVVHVWDLALDREVAQLRQPVRPVRMRFSRDGRRLVIVDERSVRIWRLPHTEEKLVLRGHTRGVPGVAFSPDGKLLASASKDRTVKIWNSLTGQLDKELTGFRGVVQTVAFSADGRLLATGDWAGSLQIWDANTWNVLTVVQHNLGGRLWATPFAPNGNFFAAAGSGGVTIWRMETDGGDVGAPLRLVLQPIAHPANNVMSSLCFSPDSKLLAWGARANRPEEVSTLHLWDLVNSQKHPAPTSRLANNVLALSFSPDSKHLVFVNEQHQIEKWNVATGQPAATFSGAELTRGNRHTALSADGVWFAVDSGRSVTVWDMVSRKLLLELPEERGTSGTVWSLAWSPDRARLAVGSSDGGLVIWNIPKIREQLAAIGLDW
jgi:WD40 repeat protein/serine/threonine protein kinase